MPSAAMTHLWGRLRVPRALRLDGSVSLKAKSSPIVLAKLRFTTQIRKAQALIVFLIF